MMLMNEYYMNDRVSAMDGMDIYMRIEGLNAGSRRADNLQYEMGLLGGLNKEDSGRITGIRSLLATILAAKV